MIIGTRYNFLFLREQPLIITVTKTKKENKGACLVKI